MTFALFDHPTNLRHPARMFTMAARFVYPAATLNLWKAPYTLEAASPLVLRYGVALWYGKIEPAVIEAVYQRWLFLSRAECATILFAATLYGIGKTYLWPTMLGIVAERFPKGGALSLNATSAVGMMSARVMGAVFLGLIQDRAVEKRLRSESPALHE